MLCKEVLVCSVLFLAHMMMAFPSGAPTGGACGTRRPIHGNNTVCCRPTGNAGSPAPGDSAVACDKKIWNRVNFMTFNGVASG